NIFIKHVLNQSTIAVVNTECSLISFHVNNINIPKYDIPDCITAGLESNFKTIAPLGIPQNTIGYFNVTCRCLAVLSVQERNTSLDRNTVVLGTYEATVYKYVPAGNYIDTVIPIISTDELYIAIHDIFRVAARHSPVPAVIDDDTFDRDVFGPRDANHAGLPFLIKTLCA